jgi:hypothetical protein
VWEKLIGDSPARYLKLPPGQRPRAVVWTPRRVKEWKRTGQRPAVAVWTPVQTAQFLEFISGRRLYAGFHLIALRGLRRGEAAGLGATLTWTTRSPTSAGRSSTPPARSCCAR